MNIPELDENFFKKAQVRNPVEKTKISIRIDNDVLNFFKSQDGKYQSKINAVLRTYFETIKSANPYASLLTTLLHDGID